MSELDRILDRLGLDLPDADRKAWEAILARPDVSRHAVLRRLGRWGEWRRSVKIDRPSNQRELFEYLLAQEIADREALRPTGKLYEDEFDTTDLGLCLACGLRLEIVKYSPLGLFEGEHLTLTELPDPCLGILPGVSYACCGHGLPGGCSVSGPGLPRGGLHGPAAARWMRGHGGDPPPEAFMFDSIGRAS